MKFTELQEMIDSTVLNGVSSSLFVFLSLISSLFQHLTRNPPRLPSRCREHSLAGGAKSVKVAKSVDLILKLPSVSSVLRLRLLPSKRR